MEHIEHMERKPGLAGVDGTRLLIALGAGLIGCLTRIIDHDHDTAGRMMDAGDAPDIRIGELSLRFGRDA